MRGRRRLLGVTALATATGLLGAGTAAGVSRWRETHLSPTARTAPRPSAPGRALGARTVFQTGGESGKLALTFDDGPDPRWTPLVLDMLARLQARATFFVLGSAAQAHPELIAREVAEGHEVAVHNWVHTDVYGVDFPELTHSVRRTCEAITAAGAPSPRLWRPPYGRVDAPAMMVASQQGLDVLLWSVHTPSASAAAAVKDVAGAGSVVLCHDGRTQPSEALFAALEGAVRSLQGQGLTITTGSDLLSSASEHQSELT
ncbi:polysaccharide deacetylase family protein [Actinomyces viscosus]|uniref:Bifunctional xylanase/deacetylase n=2 Tax=Actinomyces viscosus TaxID=1656 RepID=A0A3S4WI26_ACTVI|nr:polysaccharide deacetylase family protein [Actinomyces viscosus]VEI14481.1 Bifunctional xylanase/deacetylase precursor [Actinomyces viscosus]